MAKYHKLIFAFLLQLDMPHRGTILSEHFLTFRQQYGKDARLSIPALVATNQLLLHVPTDTEFHRRIPELTWNAVKGSANPQKYLLAVDVFCSLIPLVPEYEKGQELLKESDAKYPNLHNVAPYLYVLLGHKLPRVRSYTATELYTALLSIDDGEHPDDSQRLQEAIQLLQTTDWMVVNESRTARERIWTLIKAIGIPAT